MQLAIWLRSASFLGALAAPLFFFYFPAHADDDEPGVYVPDMHPTYREEVAARRRLARGAEDPLTKAASQACGIDLDFCIRLKPNMRREVMLAPESDPGPNDDFYTAGRRWLLNEMRLYGSVNRSERKRTARKYGSNALTHFVGLSMPGPDETRSAMLVSFTVNSSKQYSVLDKQELLNTLWTDCYITDITGDGLIDVATVVSAGVSGSGGLDVFTLLPNGKLKSCGYLKSAYGVASVVDLNQDGIWEIETQAFVSYEGGGGSYTYNLLSRYDHRNQRWIGLTDGNRHAYRQQRWFYRWLARSQRKARTSGAVRDDGNVPEILTAKYRGELYRLNLGSYSGTDPRQTYGLLKSWDRSAGPDYRLSAVQRMTVR